MQIDWVKTIEDIFSNQVSCPPQVMGLRLDDPLQFLGPLPEPAHSKLLAGGSQQDCAQEAEDLEGARLIEEG